MEPSVVARGSYTVVVEEAVIKNGEGKIVGRIKRFGGGSYSSTSGGDYGNSRPTLEEAKDAFIDAYEREMARR